MYILISLLVLIISYYLFKRASGSLDIRCLNISSLVFYYLFVMTFIGAIGILYHIEPKGYVPEDASLRFYGWIAVMYTMIMVPVGMLLACAAFKIRSMKILLSQYHSSPIKPQFTIGDSSFRHTLYLFSMLSIFAIGYIIISQWHSIPLFSLLSGNTDYHHLNRLRRSSGLSNQGFLNIFILLQAGFAFIYTFSAYAYWKMYKKFKYLIWFVCMALMVIVITTYALEKGRVLFFFLGLILVRNMIFRKIKARKFFILILIFFFLIGLLSIFFQGMLQGTGKTVTLLNILITGFQAFWARCVFVQLVCSYMCFDIFPRSHPHLWFSSTGRFIHEVLGLKYNPDYGIIVMSFFRPVLVASGEAGHATTVFIGEAWANFGIFGILFFPLWVGFFIQAFHIFFLKFKKTPLNLALYAQFAILMPVLSGIKGFYYPEWIFEYLVMIFILFFVASILKSVGKKSFQVENVSQC